MSSIFSHLFTVLKRVHCLFDSSFFVFCLTISPNWHYFPKHCKRMVDKNRFLIGCWKKSVFPLIVTLFGKFSVPILFFVYRFL